MRTTNKLSVMQTRALLSQKHDQKVARWEVMRLIYNGEIPAEKPNREWQIDEANLPLVERALGLTEKAGQPTPSIPAGKKAAIPPTEHSLGLPTRRTPIEPPVTAE